MKPSLTRWLAALTFAASQLLAPSAAHAQTQSNSALAESAFRAWEKGESTGNYAEFRALLSPQFELFSHPVQPARGVFRGAQAREMMNSLIAQRTQTPNQLKFANVRTHQTQNSFLFEFDSEGKVSGHPYKGWNAIQISIGSDNKIASFREYLGDIDPAWFQKR
jgi:ketosteroid isomerase-like protein